MQDAEAVIESYIENHSQYQQQEEVSRNADSASVEGSDSQEVTEQKISLPQVYIVIGKKFFQMFMLM